MAGHNHHVSYNLDEQFEFTSAGKRRVLTALAIGVVMFVIGIALLAMGVGEGGHGEKHAAVTPKTEASHSATVTTVSHEEGHKADEHAQAGHGNEHVPVDGKASEHAEAAAHHGGEGHHYHWINRVVANIWLNNVFFIGLAVIGLFFVAVQYVAWAGWSSVIKRVPLAFGAWIPIGGVLLVVTFLLGNHQLFHWTAEGITDPNSPNFDEIIANKSGFLNVPFFIARTVIFVGLWYVLWRVIRGNMLKEDQLAANSNDPSYWHKNNYMGAIFLFIFAVSSSVLAWDWTMSIDPHWFSTLFGWYHFASWHVAGIATVTLTIILLKEKGYMKYVSENHMHDLGKFMFAFSVFWAYLWVAQFLLYWYANISEETIYFIQRRDGWDGHYTFIFFFNLFINFFFPFLFLMTRDSKRKMLLLKIAAMAIIFGHWMDFYLMIMPGTIQNHSGFGFVEFGTVTIYASAFVYVVSQSLASAKLVGKNHPMIHEALHHEV